MTRIIENKLPQELIEVVFDDPAEFDTNYDRNTSPIQCSAIGWLVDQNPAFIRISWLKEEDDEPYVGLAIPMGCVKKINHYGIDGFKYVEGLN